MPLSHRHRRCSPCPHAERLHGTLPAAIAARASQRVSLLAKMISGLRLALCSTVCDVTCASGKVVRPPRGPLLVRERNRGECATCPSCGGVPWRRRITCRRVVEQEHSDVLKPSARLPAFASEFECACVCLRYRCGDVWLTWRKWIGSYGLRATICEVLARVVFSEPPTFLSAQCSKARLRCGGSNPSDRQVYSRKGR